MDDPFVLRQFLAIFLITVSKSFTKPGVHFEVLLKQLLILYGSKVMTQNTKSSVSGFGPSYIQWVQFDTVNYISNFGN